MYPKGSQTCRKIGSHSILHAARKSQHKAMNVKKNDSKQPGKTAADEFQPEKNNFHTNTTIHKAIRPHTEML